MGKIKIINDPVYGFIDVPHGLVLSVVDHPWFQRLRRIKQGGFSNLVYPGATHTRYHHALGAYHLGSKTVNTLRKKSIQISEDEEVALQMALLLHDMGHGPFSHSLEGLLVPVSHEAITGMYLTALNEEFHGKLTLAMAMFNDTYDRPFFHQLISGELDLDRMDYLARDSFYSGVSEGVIGYDRIIHMLNVVDSKLVVEEKGLNSIEKFLLARKLMYAQVYHHKMVVASEEMLSLFFERIKDLLSEGVQLPESPLISFMKGADLADEGQLIRDFSLLDDSDVLQLLKQHLKSDDELLSVIAHGLINRRVFKLYSGNKKEVNEFIEQLQRDEPHIPERLIRRGKVSSKIYSIMDDAIIILMKNGILKTYGDVQQGEIPGKKSVHYVCYPHISMMNN